MDLFDILAVLVSLSAVLSWLNHRFLRLPTAIGLMFSALAVSILLLALGPLSGGLESQVRLMLASVDFNETLLHGMLSFLLFAGALHVNLDDLAEKFHVSAPIAIVVAGLLIGNQGRAFAMSDRTREHLDTFWGLARTQLDSGE